RGIAPVAGGDQLFQPCQQGLAFSGSPAFGRFRAGVGTVRVHAAVGLGVASGRAYTGPGPMPGCRQVLAWVTLLPELRPSFAASQRPVATRRVRSPPVRMPRPFSRSTTSAVATLPLAPGA